MNKDDVIKEGTLSFHFYYLSLASRFDRPMQLINRMKNNRIFLVSKKSGMLFVKINWTRLCAPTTNKAITALPMTMFTFFITAPPFGFPTLTIAMDKVSILIKDAVYLKRLRSFDQNLLLAVRYNNLQGGSALGDEQMIQRAVEWIEVNLERNIQLADVASFAGYSKFHFHRLFQSVLNMSVDQYIRTRRLAAAAVLLIHSDERILDIAFYASFNSQEAFSRAFKKTYRLAPGEYRRIMRSIIFKQEEECMMQEIKGWFLSGSHPHLYKMGIDRQVVHTGNASGYLHSQFVTEAAEFATMMQQFKADKFLGKRLKLSCFIKCEDVDQFAGAWMRVDDQLGDVLQFDNMGNRPIKGTLDWNFYSIVLDVPSRSQMISFGVLLQGKGKLWVNQFQFEEVPETYATTNLEVMPELLDEPVNLSFDE